MCAKYVVKHCAYLYHLHLQVLQTFDALNPGIRSRGVSEDPWEVNPEEFKVFLAVPGHEDKRTYTEHVYTISEEDLSDAATDDVAEIDTEDITSGEERTPGHPRKKGRRLFRLCHSRCVQASCLPIKDVSVYSDCSDDCKLSCTRNILQ